MTPPKVSVLQLDTTFERIAGDVGSALSYACAPQILRVGGAGVAQIVTGRPELIDIAPFEQALDAATGDVVVTSCGFLSYWQEHLAARSTRPFISSALIALDTLAQTHAPDEVMILTYDADCLGSAHLGRHGVYAASISGLGPDMHLRAVIDRTRPDLDPARAQAEIVAHVRRYQTPQHRHILLECTNLPPYRAAISAATGLPVTDILTVIEATWPGTVHPDFS